ncbi:MAG: hypothetical protein IPH57_08450 [Saprospiraceae bacterium]|nr:hypothetical protein [Saprospiraceae bacterium]
MKKLFILILIPIFFCCSESKKNLISVENDYLSFFDPKIKMKINGKEEDVYKVKVFFDTVQLNENELFYGNDSMYQYINLIFNKLKFDLNHLAQSINENNNIKLKIKVLDKKNINFFDSLFVFKINVPPITKIISVKGNNLKILNINNFDNKVSTLIKFIANKSPHLTENIDYNDNFPILKKNDFIDYRIEVDTLYDIMIVETYYSSGKNGSDKELIQYIKETLIPEKEDWSSNSKIIKENGKIYISGKTEAYYEGLTHLYLISVKNDNSFSYNLVGTFKVDTLISEFENERYGTFYGNYRAKLGAQEGEDFSKWNEGTAYIYNESFYGYYQPYSVPFVCTINGDIQYVYINNKKINFKRRKEFLVRMPLYLSQGYNRIEVKLIDKAGNTTNSFIPITIAPLD